MRQASGASSKTSLKSSATRSGVTTDGRAFIEAYNSFEPTMIILDTIMQGMAGNEIILWLRNRNLMRG